jgi:hypothetical protein
MDQVNAIVAMYGLINCFYLVLMLMGLRGISSVKEYYSREWQVKHLVFGLLFLPGYIVLFTLYLIKIIIIDPFIDFMNKKL